MSLLSSVRSRVRLPGFVSRIQTRSYVMGFVASLILGGGWYAFAQGGTQTQAAASTLVQVGRQTIVSSVKATGDVTFANEQELRFNQKGKVTNVYFKEGDRVAKGQLLAQLDTSSLMADIRQAQLSVAASALQLRQLQQDKEKTVLDAQTDLAVSKQKLPSDLASAQRAVTEKEAAVKQAESALEQAQATAVQDLAATAQDILTDSEDLLDTLHGVLVNDASSRYDLGANTLQIYHRLYSDYNQKNQTEWSYNTAIAEIKDMRDMHGEGIQSIRDPSKLSAVLADARSVAAAIHTLADNTYQLLQGAEDDPHDFTVSDINALKQTVISARTSAAGLTKSADTALAGLTSNKGRVTSITVQQKSDALQSARDALVTAKDNLRVMETQTPAELASQEKALASTLTSTDINIRLKENDVAQKSTSLQKTSKTIEDYQLRAPFDGVIRRLDYQVGDNLLDTGEDKFMVLENPDFLIVTILLDQVDVIRVKKDMTASIVFDALPDRTFTGAIDEINSTPVEESGVVSYEVSIRLATPRDLTILSGMTSTVQIETARKENVVAVPNLSLQRQNGQATVKLAGGQTVAVQTGTTDGRYTEILSGIQEGDSIVSMNVAAAQQTGNSQNTAQQMFRLGGGGGGGGATFAPAGGTRTGGQNTQR